MIKGITYTDHRMTISAQRCVDSMLMNGVDEVKIYGPDDIDHYFYQANYCTLNQDKGAGLWLWKPYIIWTELLKLNDGDILIYSDAGVEFINDVRLVINDMTGDLLTFEGTEPHIKWCKKKVLEFFHIGEEEARKMVQLQSSVIYVKRSDRATIFISEWLRYCQNESLLNDVLEVEYDDFIEHRHDQAILSCMGDIQRLWWSTDYKNNPGDTYLMFKHHRKRNTDYK